MTVPVRDKFKLMEPTIRSVLSQTYSPMDIVFSDQGSTDDSLRMLLYYAERYEGPNKVYVLQCPETEPKGMVGFNTHLNWLHNTLSYDLNICVSADDINAVTRAEETVKAYKEHAADYYLTGMLFQSPEGQVNGRNAEPGKSGYVSTKEHLTGLIGGSTSQAWTSDFWSKWGPIEGCSIIDLAMPYFAACDKGLYYLHDLLFAYVEHADPNNTGLGGQRRAADGMERAQVEEKAGYQLVSTLYWMMRKAETMQKNGFVWKEEDQQALHDDVILRSHQWAIARDTITAGRIPPLPLRA